MKYIRTYLKIQNTTEPKRLLVIGEAMSVTLVALIYVSEALVLSLSLVTILNPFTKNDHFGF